MPNTRSEDHTSATAGDTALLAGDRVKVEAGYANGGEAERIYEYRGFTADFSLDGVTFSSPTGTVDLVTGDTVQVGNSIYRYTGDGEQLGATLTLTDLDGGFRINVDQSGPVGADTTGA